MEAISEFKAALTRKLLNENQEVTFNDLGVWKLLYGSEKNFQEAVRIVTEK